MPATIATKAALLANVEELYRSLPGEAALEEDEIEEEEEEVLGKECPASGRRLRQAVSSHREAPSRAAPQPSQAPEGKRRRT